MKALTKLKVGKCSGIGNACAEILKVDMLTTAEQLGRLYEKIWETDSIPSDWQKEDEDSQERWPHKMHQLEKDYSIIDTKQSSMQYHNKKNSAAVDKHRRK